MSYIKKYQNPAGHLPEPKDNTNVVVWLPPEGGTLQETFPNSRQVTDFDNHPVITQGYRVVGSKGNDHRVGQNSIFGERKYVAPWNQSIAQRLWNNFTDALHLTSPPTYQDGYGRILNAENPFWYGAKGQELKRMGKTALGTGTIIGLGYLPWSFAASPTATIGAFGLGLGTDFLAGKAMDGIEKNVLNRSGLRFSNNQKYAVRLASGLYGGTKGYKFGKWLSTPDTPIVYEPRIHQNDYINAPGNAMDPVMVDPKFTAVYNQQMLGNLVSHNPSTLTLAERYGVPKVVRNQVVKPNPNAGASTSVNTYLINRSYHPLDVKDDMFVLKSGEPISVRGVKKRPVTIHFTTDTQVKPHSGMDSWANAPTTYMIPYKSVVKYNGLPANIEPMDTWWTAGSTFQFPIKGVKVLTSDPALYRRYKLQGVDVEFSMDGYNRILKEEGMRDIVENWIRGVQNKTGTRPSVDTYRQMELETGLNAGVSPKLIAESELYREYDPTIVDYYHAPPTHANSWSFDTMIDPQYLGDTPLEQQRAMIKNVVNGIASELDYDYPSFTVRDLPALQKIVQTYKQFDFQMPTKYRDGSIRDYSDKKDLVEKINRILRGEIVVPYKQGGKLNNK